MATQIQSLTTAWTDITAALSLAVDSNYIAQNTGNDIIYLVEASVQPADTAKGHIMRPAIPGDGTVLIQAADNFYMRTDSRESEVTVDISFVG